MELREYAATLKAANNGQEGHKNDAEAAEGIYAASAGMAPYKAAYRAAFGYHEKYAGHIPQTEAEWDAAISDLTAIAQRFGNSDFALSLLFAVLDEIERQCLLQRI